MSATCQGLFPCRVFGGNHIDIPQGGYGRRQMNQWKTNKPTPKPIQVMAIGMERNKAEKNKEPGKYSRWVGLGSGSAYSPSTLF